MANEAEIQRWNDERWTKSWPARETLTTSVTPFLLAAIELSAGQRVVDIGCGGGGLAIALASQVAPGGLVVGVDVSEDLLRLAGERAAAAGVDNMDFVQVDMQSGTLGGDRFDLAVSQFGVMFFDEPVKAFANIRAHLRAQGILTFACWQTVDRNPWHVATALGHLVTPKPPPAAGKSVPGPFSLGDVATTEGILREAGFVDIGVEPHQMSITAPASAVVDPGLLEMLGVPPHNMAAAVAAVDQHLQRFQVASDSFEFPLAFQIVTARTD
jgi:ubiquinone/menaquinone biosynthesis C-methylase UbiE